MKVIAICFSFSHLFVMTLFFCGLTKSVEREEKMLLLKGILKIMVSIFLVLIQTCRDLPTAIVGTGRR